MKTLLFLFSAIFVSRFISAAEPVLFRPPAGVPPAVLATIDARMADLARMTGKPLAGATIASGQGSNVSYFLTNLVETRTRSNHTLNLTLQLAGRGSAPTAVVGPPKIGRALDNEGQSLLPFGRGSGGRGPATAGQGGLRVPLDLAFPPKTVVQLVPASDSATSLAVVEGELELYTPSEGTGSIAVIEKIRGARGPVQHPLLARHGAEVTLVTAENWASVAASVPNVSKPDFERGPVLFIRDPERAVVDCLFQTAAGGELIRISKEGHGNNEGTLWQFFQADPLPTDARLSVYLYAPGATVTIPFRFENLPL